MTEYLEATGSGNTLGRTGSAIRRPYVKPFVRRLDVVDTQGKSYISEVESTYVAPS